MPRTAFAALFALCTSSAPVAGAQMNLGDLYEVCTGSGDVNMQWQTIQEAKAKDKIE